MYVDVWEWFRRSESEMIRSGDTLRRRLVNLAYDGWRYREIAEAEKSVASFQEGARLAEQLNEPYWRVFHQCWAAEMMYYLKNDYQGTLDAIVRVVAECRKELYADCPVRSQVFFVLANVYYMIDFFSYEQDIIELLDYIENQIVMTEDIHLRLLHTRSQIAYEHEDYALAESQSHQLLDRVGTNLYRKGDATMLLGAIAYARGDLPLALEYNHIAQSYAHSIQVQRSIATCKLWQAVYLQRMGDTSAAYESYQAGIGYYEQYHLPKEVTYHNTCADYLEMCGQYDQALELREALLAQVTQRESIYNEMTAHWQYCRILGRLGKPLDNAFKAAHLLTAKIRKPEIYLTKLLAIENGNYYEFAWQRDRATKQ